MGEGGGSVELPRKPGSVVVEVFFSVQRRHATRTGRSDRLAIHMVGDIAGGKYSCDGGGCRIALAATLDAQVAIMHRQLSSEQIGIGFVSNGTFQVELQNQIVASNMFFSQVVDF